MSGLFEEAADVNALRIDLRELVAWNAARGLWDRSDIEEIGQAIKAALESGDRGRIADWRAWIATQAEEVRRMKAMAALRMRALEASIRSARDKAA